MTHTHDSLIGDIVAADFRSAAVFERHGIDFCCGGQRSLGDACRRTGMDPERLAHDLAALSTSSPTADDLVASAPTDELLTHIVSRHHEYLRRAMPLISGHLAKLVQVHGARHHELARVQGEFDAVYAELRHHLMKEEHILFPWLVQMHAASVDGRPMPTPPFGTVRNPIRMMEEEHQQAGDELRILRDLTVGFTVPDDGCATYRVAMEELAEFERDLHRHIHLENNVLFPRAVALEDGGRVTV